jgi:serine/threonine protein kinase
LDPKPTGWKWKADPMGLESGTRLGPYEIIAFIGAGGVGEVYKARDTRLDRMVAIKVLGQELQSRPEVLQGFEREARVISTLNHPNIIGTLQYMAPDQLEGKDADVRSDIFGFGCLLYEMIAGRRAFEGQSQAGLITAIMAAASPGPLPPPPYPPAGP